MKNVVYHDVRFWLSLLSFLAAFGSRIPEVQAQEADAPVASGRQPLPFVQRPLTLPEVTARADVDIPLYVLDGEVGLGTTLGAGFGILSDLQIDATIVPLLYIPEAGYGYLNFLDPPNFAENPTIGGTFRFIRGEFELGARLKFLIPAGKDTGFTINPGVPARLHIGDFARLDAAVDTSLIFANEFVFGLSVPIAFSVQIIDPLHAGLQTGFSTANFDGDLTAIPFGFFTGYAIEGADGPFIDIYSSFAFPLFITPGANQTVQTAFFAIHLGASAYFYL